MYGTDTRADAELNNSINAAAIRLVHRYSAVNFRKITALGLHPGQLPFMRAIDEHEGIRMREMADLLHIKPPTVTVTVKRLEKAGLICRQGDAEDMRVSRIYLTEKGKSIKHEIKALLDENERILTDGFSEEERVQLLSFFRRMSDNLTKAMAGTDDADIPLP